MRVMSAGAAVFDRGRLEGSRTHARTTNSARLTNTLKARETADNTESVLQIKSRAGIRCNRRSPCVPRVDGGVARRRQEKPQKLS